MRIVEFAAENIKRLKAVEIRPEGNVVEITGRNGQGKTSVLDAIWWALGGEKVIQSEPIRDGADTGSIMLDLGDFRVTRKFKRREDGSVIKSIVVENSDGMKFSSPQEILNSFLGDLTFDPLAFTRMKPADQLTALRSLVPGFDFTATDKAIKDAFEARTEANRTIRDLRARVNAIAIPDDAPQEPLSVTGLVEELNAAMEANANSGAVSGKISATKSMIEGTRGRIERLRHDLATAEAELEELQDTLDGLGTPAPLVDTDVIRKRIADAERLNTLASARQQKSMLQKELFDAENHADALTKYIDGHKEAAAKAVREAALPFDGIELAEDGVLLNGHPFNQASDAEQLRVSIAVAGALNPKLRVIRVRDGSLLDDEAMVALRAYAEANDLQIWIERVDSSGKVGVVIEDGQIAAPALEAAE